MSPRTATNKLSIDISQWDVDLTTFGSVSLQCWDFASNDVQAEALQMFLTERAIYVVAFDVRARDAFEQCNAWCSVIFSRAPQAWVIVVFLTTIFLYFFKKTRFSWLVHTPTQCHLPMHKPLSKLFICVPNNQLDMPTRCAALIRLGLFLILLKFLFFF